MNKRKKNYLFKNQLVKNDVNIAKAISLAFSSDKNCKYKRHIKVLLLDKTGNHKPAYKLIRPEHANEDINNILLSKDRDIYVSANTYKGEVISVNKYKDLKEQGLNTFLYATSFDGKSGYRSIHSKKNLFSYKNIVLDVDWHDASENEIEMFSSLIIDNLEGYFDKSYMPNIVNFTGRGIQFWWCIKEEALQLQFLINKITKKLIELLNIELDKNSWLPIDTKVDESASLNEAGLFRMFGTQNTKSSLHSKTLIAKDKKYTIDELKEALNITSSSGTYSKKTTQYTENTFINRVRELEEYILSDTSEPENRHIKLHLLYNALITANIPNSKERIYEINKHFRRPLSINDINYIFNTIDRNGIYKYKNTTIASKLGLKSFGCKYKKSSENRLLKLRQKTEAKKRIRNMYVCEEYAKTMNYKKAAKAGNVCLNTAKKIITECADVVTALIKKIEHAKERKIFAYFLNHRHQRKQVKDLSKYNTARNIIIKFLNIRNTLLKWLSPFVNRCFLSTNEYLAYENQIISSGRFDYSAEEIHTAIAPNLKLIR